MYVRVSKAAYAPTLHATVSARLNASSESLVPAIRKLPGCLGYFRRCRCSLEHDGQHQLLGHT